MLGSALSIAGPNIILNTIIAEQLKQFADELENAADFTTALNALIKRTIKNHKRIIFNGDGYSEEWEVEAERRGLLNLKTTVDALPHFIAPKNIKLFTDHHIFTEAELHSRYEILLETYSKVINIEALTMLDMVKQDIIPAISKYIGSLSNSVIAQKSVLNNIACKAELDIVSKLSASNDAIYEKSIKLEKSLGDIKLHESDVLETAKEFREVFYAMQNLRSDVDFAETYTSSEIWPYPTYADLIFKI
ncbi:MAG: hypothetical protein RR177_05260 [Oscillospiraceae bacterium]